MKNKTLSNGKMAEDAAFRI